MKILLVSSTFPPRKFGGITAFSHDLARSLVRRGHKVTVYTTDVNDTRSRLDVRSSENVDGIDVRYFRNISNSLASRRLYLPRGITGITKHEIDNFDIVHLNDYRDLPGVIIHYYAKKYGVPYVLQANGSAPRSGKLRGLKRIFDIAFGYNILRDSDKVIAACETEVNEYKELGVTRDKVIVLPPLYDVQEFSQPPPLGQFKHKFHIKEKHIVLFLGRLHRIKGIDFLIESFHELIRGRVDAILVIIGPDDGYGTTLRKLVNRLNLSHQVLFVEYLRGAEKLSALVDATMLVQVSMYERGPGSPFEAVLCGTPIIITKDTGAGEIAGKLDAGYLVDFGNIPALVNAMQKILDDPTEALGKTQKARQYLMMNRSWEKGVKEYERLYESVIQNRERSLET